MRYKILEVLIFDLIVLRVNFNSTTIIRIIMTEPEKVEQSDPEPQK